jgi:hypothetical protein
MKRFCIKERLERRFEGENTTVSKVTIRGLDRFDFYSIWEELFNADFNSAGFRRIKSDEAGHNAFVTTMSLWKKRTNATRIIAGAAERWGRQI